MTGRGLTKLAGDGVNRGVVEGVKCQDIRIALQVAERRAYQRVTVEVKKVLRSL